MTRPETRPGYSGPELCQMTARAVVAALETGDVTPDDLIDAAMARIGQTSPAINAMVTTCEDRARAAAKTLPTGTLLAGLPFGVKDLTPVSGVRTTWGTPAFADHVPDATHPLIERIEQNGGIVLGKTNTPEMGAGANTFNAVFGHTRNPWDTRLNPGGSSGGAAAGLAVGETWLSHGSDLGGSLRTPAAYCGVVGLRPSPGVAWGGPASDIFDTMPVQGPMARNVADCALMLDTMAGFDRRAPLSWPALPDGYLGSCLADAGPVRIAFAPDLGGIAPVEPDMATALAAALGALPAPEFTVEETAPPTAQAEATFRTLRALGFWVDARQTPDAVSRHFKPTLQQNTREGAALVVDDIAEALAARTKLTLDLRAFLADWDVIAAPVAGLFPLEAEIEFPPAVAGVASRDYLSWLAFAMPATLASLPAMSLPVGFANGLPVGLQLIGQPRGEARLLQVARAIEEALALPQTPIDPRVLHTPS